MPNFPIFLSVVIVVRNEAGELERILTEATKGTAPFVKDYEIIIVDNSSQDESISILKQLTSPSGLPNLQVYALTKEVDADTASWVGFENALGDYVAIFDPLADDINFLSAMLKEAVKGADVVFASNKSRANQNLPYRIANSSFNALYRWFNGIHLAREAPRFRILSKRVVNFILQHPQPAIAYRHLPATGGFARVNLHYKTLPQGARQKKLRDSIDLGIRLLLSTTRGPMRLVTFLSLFGALANLAYSGYVLAVALFKEDVAPGWVSLSLQQSGMFFLISLVLLVLGEYILHMASLTSEGPLYHLGQEFTSARMIRRERLNLEEVDQRVRYEPNPQLDRGH